MLVVEATELTEAAVSTDEVVKIATDLQEQMDIITAEAGNQLTFGADIDEALAKYQEVAASKLAEFGIELE